MLDRLISTVSSCLVDMYNTSLGPDDVTEADESDTQIHLWDTPHAQQAILPKLLHLYAVLSAFPECSSLIHQFQQLFRRHAKIL